MIEENSNNEKLTRKFFNKGSSQSTIDEEDIGSLENFENLVDDLISHKITINELPDTLLPFLDEIKTIKEKPNPPEENECCGSGCIPCVWDIYDMKIERRQRAIEKIHDKFVDGKDNSL